MEQSSTLDHNTTVWTDGVTAPFNVAVAKRLGSIHSALVLHRLMITARDSADPDSWFSVTTDDMERLTAVGERGYADARRSLATLGLIETRRAGMPARIWIRFDIDALAAWIDQVVATPLPPKPKKAPIPTRLRWQVFLNDDFRCRHCGVREGLAVDHIVPESKGGKLDLDNLQTLCRSCNSRKGAR